MDDKESKGRTATVGCRYLEAAMGHLLEPKSKDDEHISLLKSRCSQNLAFGKIITNINRSCTKWTARRSKLTYATRRVFGFAQGRGTVAKISALRNGSGTCNLIKSSPRLASDGPAPLLGFQPLGKFNRLAPNYVTPFFGRFEIIFSD